MKKNILVFGAGGFMGTYLIDALVKLNYNVTASDITEVGQDFYTERGIPFIKIDITNTNEFLNLKNGRYDVVIHLAAHQPANVSSRNYDPKDYIKINVLGTLNILDYCEKSGAGKIIYASSHRNTQGLWESGKPIKEEDGRSIKYDTEYTMFSVSETAAQDCVEYYRTQHNLNGIIFRLPPVYGYGPHTEIFKDGRPIKTGFQIFMEKSIAGQPLELWGDSGKGRDIIYVKDVISAFIKAIESNTAGGLYNITSGKKLTLREEAETIAKVFWTGPGKPVLIEKPEKENNMDPFVYDISKAKKELDWEPEFSFEDMLYDYIKESESKSFSYLLQKRKNMLDNN
jgi:UDP-glucose 4-epimerase